MDIQNKNHRFVTYSGNEQRNFIIDRRKKKRKNDSVDLKLMKKIAQTLNKFKHLITQAFSKKKLYIYMN